MYDGKLGNFTFTNFDKVPKNGSITISNQEGHTLNAVVYPRRVYSISGGGLLATFKTNSFHFHWGSEHTVNGKQYVAEVSVHCL